MTASDKPAPDGALLTGYLLGMLPANEAERLGELSITDDDFALRLSAAENDLVDAYVRDELDPDNLERFRAWYLASPLRLEKVDFARTLQLFEQRSGDQRSSAIAAAGSPRNSADKSFWQRLLAPRVLPVWGFAGAALAAVALYLAVENGRLRHELSRAQDQQAALAKPVDAQRPAAATAKEPQQARASPIDLDGLKTVAVLLVPPTRGPARLPTLSIAPGTNIVVLLLTLESDDFPGYRVEVKEAASNQTVWKSADLKTTPSAGNKIVSVSFPSRLLKPQNYLVELHGISSSGRAEFISGYPVRVVIG